MEPIFRQGDVYFQRINTPKKQGNVKAQKSVTVAYGEVTGHHHTVYPIDKKTKVTSVLDGEATIVTIINGMAGLFHGSTQQIEQVRSGKTLDWEKEDAHAPQLLEPGVYRFWVQTEYDPQVYRRKVLD